MDLKKMVFVRMHGSACKGLSGCGWTAAIDPLMNAQLPYVQNESGDWSLLECYDFTE